MDRKKEEEKKQHSDKECYKGQDKKDGFWLVVDRLARKMQDSKVIKNGKGKHLSTKKNEKNILMQARKCGQCLWIFSPSVITSGEGNKKMNTKRGSYISTAAGKYSVPSKTH